MSNWANLETPKSEPLSDLEWMLRSSMVSDDALAERLLREYFSDIARMCLEMTGDTEQIHNLISQSIAQAVLQRHAYRGEVPANTWLLELAKAQIWRLAAQKSKRRRKIKTEKLFEPAAPEEGKPVEIQVPNLSKLEFGETMTHILDQIQREKRGRSIIEKGKEMLLAGIALAVISY